MKKGLTELVFILDRSGSMSGLEGDTIGGFNSLIEKQKGVDGQCYVSTVLFANASHVLYDRVPLDQVRPMTPADYTVGGCTALLDAIGDAVQHIGNIHKYARSEDVPERTMFIITTDGMENASHRHTAQQVKAMIQRQQERYGWEFLFLAANIDAVETAGRMGIAPERAVDYRPDSQGTRVLYDTVAETVCAARMGAPLADGWSDAIKKDTQRK